MKGLFIVFLLLLTQVVYSQNPLKVVFENSSAPNTLPLFDCTLFIDSTDAPVVEIAAKALQSDIEQITNTKLQIRRNTKMTDFAIIIGTVGKSRLIDSLEKKGKISYKTIKGKWETYQIAIVDTPFPEVETALVIAGSDRRGTAYGVFELSKMMGVSPWTWWADVKPEKHSDIYIKNGSPIISSPSVQYRGVFLNDEDWGLKPWAANKMDTDVKDIAPKTYEKIFQLLLRLKANLIWPAMHDCVKAFYYYKENPILADKYGIIVGSSHCEPILRNNVFEWTENFENEYKEKPKEWRYDTNQEQVYKYWDDRAKQSKDYESLYTVGMRGVHDGNMNGPKPQNERVALLERIITDQRKILGQYKKDAPQVFCPYKEVLNLYQAGLKVPEDITLIWVDDNHGYIRQLSTPEEQKRSGGSGVYYHLSYWGAPQDYLWLSTISPALISYEMSKAYQFGAKKLWVVNVGDIKPAELETEFFMDLAWDINSFTPENAYQYTEVWAKRTFGESLGKLIAPLKNKYYALAQCGKPEHLGMLAFEPQVWEERIANYQSIANEAEKLASKVPANLKDAYFELILYPIKGACLMNEKFYYAQKSRTDEKNAIDWAKKSKSSYEQIKSITKTYNKDIAQGKWDGMMSWNPHYLEVFYMPQVHSSATELVKDTVKYKVISKAIYKDSIKSASFLAQPENTSNLISIPASTFSTKKDLNSTTIKVCKGLGLGGESISIFPFTAQPADLNNASFVEYKVNLQAEKKQVILKCLPTQAIHKGRRLRYAISVNGDAPQTVDVAILKEDGTWRENVIRGFSEGKTSHTFKKGENTIRIYFLDTGLVFNRIEIK